MGEDMQAQATRQGFVAGLRLLPESLGWLGRMRNVWLLVVVFAALQSHWRMGFRLEGDQPHGSLGKTLAAVVRTRYEGYRSPGNAMTQALRGVQRPLSTRFIVLQRPTAALADIVFGPRDPYAAPEGPRLSFEILLLNLLYAALAAGMLGWIKLALERQALSVSAFFRCVVQATGAIWCWFLLLDALKLTVTGLDPVLEYSRFTGETLQAGVLLLLLPFSFLPFTVVAWGKSIVTAFPASWRMFWSRLLMVLGFLVVFRVAAEALAVLSGVLQRYGEWEIGSHVGRFGCYLLSDLGSAVTALLLCTAFMLMVIRVEGRSGEGEAAGQGAEG
jgi:hypothetical protein